MKKIKEFIKGHERLYKFIRPIELKYYALRGIIRRLFSRFTVQLVVKKFKRITGNKDTRDILNFHNIHKGKRIFIISPGPSLREEDVIKLNDEITISVNGTITLSETIGWIPTYYLITDPDGYPIYKDHIINAGLKDVFMSTHFKKYEAELPFKPNYIEGYGRFRDIFYPNEMEISEDLYKKGYYSGGRSIATVALQLAIYMGASEIYLLGQDCDYSGSRQYFNDYPNKVKEARPNYADSFIQAMFIFYRTAKKYCEQHDIKLYNATRGGKLEELERIDLDKVLE